MPPPVALAFLGSINWDTTIFVERLPSPGEEEPVLQVEEGPGGKGANAAVAAAKILGPEKVALIGALGDDRFEPPLRRSLRDDGVASDGVVVVRGTKSGRAYVVVDSAGKKEIHTHFGANDALLAEHLGSPGGTDALASARAVVVMDVPLPTAIVAERAAKRGGARVIYSPGVRSDGPRDKVSTAFSLADDVVLDTPELARLAGGGSPRARLEHFARDSGAETAVVTMGPAGCMVASRGSVSMVQGVDLGALGLRAVNSTGSGDAFIAAYSCRLVTGDPPQEAAEWGNLAGALKATSPLTRGSPTGTALSGWMGVLRGVRLTRRDSPKSRVSRRSRPRS